MDTAGLSYLHTLFRVGVVGDLTDGAAPGAVRRRSR